MNDQFTRQAQEMFAAAKDARIPENIQAIAEDGVASIVDDQGNVYSGCNVENSSYGLTQCAERNALAAAIEAGVAPGTAHTLLIYATGFDVLAPCGACRQVISELMAGDALVISCHSETEYRSWSIEELLPYPFILS